jgi:CRP/FNR family transcriptional regulator, cyclic AMP receptor protein
MRNVDALEALVRAPLFRGLPRESLEPLAPSLHRKEIRKGGFVWHEDSPATVIYIVLQGRIEVTRTSSRGEHIVVDYFGPGDVGGLPSILIEGATRMTAGKAVEETVVLSLEREPLFALLEREPVVMRRVLDNIARLARMELHTMSEIAFLDVGGRVAHKLSDLATLSGRASDGGPITITVSQRALAAMVAASREKVNRALARLSEEGIIRKDVGSITILDPDRLRARETERRPDLGPPSPLV